MINISQDVIVEGCTKNGASFNYINHASEFDDELQSAIRAFCAA